MSVSLNWNDAANMLDVLMLEADTDVSALANTMVLDFRVKVSSFFIAYFIICKKY